MLYRLSPNRESRIAIDTQFETGILDNRQVRYSQGLWKHRNNWILTDMQLKICYLIFFGIFALI